MFILFKELYLAFEELGKFLNALASFGKFIISLKKSFENLFEILESHKPQIKSNPLIY